RNLAIDTSRASRVGLRAAQPHTGHDPAEPQEKGPEESTLRAERLTALSAALERLKKNEADALRQWASGELYLSDTGATGRRVTQAYNLVHRAKLKLRRVIGKPLE